MKGTTPGIPFAHQSIIQTFTKICAAQPEAAVEYIITFFQRQVEYTRLDVTVFGPEATERDFQFLNSLLGNTGGEPANIAGIGTSRIAHWYPINQDQYLIRTTAAKMRTDYASLILGN